MRKKLLTTLALLLMAVSGAWALTPLSGDTWDDGTKTLTVNSDPGNNYYGKTEIQNLVISASVTSLGASAFGNCTNLTSVTFAAGSTLQTIGNNAFQKIGITSITIPASVTSIGSNAFYQCGSLTSVTFAAGSLLESIGNSAFQNTGLTSITIPASVTSLGASAFYQLTNLTSVTFAAGSMLESIGNNAFQKIGITSITIPASVTSIGNNAFYQCGSLSSVTFAAGSLLASIGDTAFGQSGLTSISFPASVTSIGSSVFYNCNSLASVTINSNPTIGVNAFPNGTTVTMNLTANEGKTGEYWMTFFSRFYDFTTDANTKIYKAAVNGTKTAVVLTEVADIPKNNAAVLKSSNEAIVMTLASSTSGDYTGNELQGTYEVTDTPGNTYCLSKETSGSSPRGVGFYTYTLATIPANRAYLVVAGGPSSARGSLGIDDDDNTTVIDAPKALSAEADGTLYDLSGRRVMGQPQKGIYVKNGKKFVIK